MATSKVFTYRISRASALAGRHPHVSFRAALMEALSRQTGDYKAVRNRVRPVLPKQIYYSLSPSEKKAFAEPATLSDAALAEIEKSPNKRAISMARGTKQETVGVEYKRELAKKSTPQKKCSANCTPLENGPTFVFTGMIDLEADGTAVEIKTRMGPKARQNGYDLDQLACYSHALKAKRGILREILSTGEVHDTEYSAVELEMRWLEIVEALKKPAKLLNTFETASDGLIEELRKREAFNPKQSEF
jgi:hypothetical protein